MTYRSWEARLTMKGPVVDIEFCSDDEDEGCHGQECLRRCSSEPTLQKFSRSHNSFAQVRITIDPYSKPLAEAYFDAASSKYKDSACHASMEAFGQWTSEEHDVKDIIPETLAGASVKISHLSQSNSAFEAELEGAPRVPIEHPEAKRDDKQKKANKTTKEVRPCRGQRIRHRKFFEQMKLAIDADPEGFDIGTIPLPPSLAQGSGYKSNLLDKIETYKRDAMREREIEAILSPLRFVCDAKSMRLGWGSAQCNRREEATPGESCAYLTQQHKSMQRASP